MEFPEWLQGILTERGISIRELSRMSGMSPAAISNVLNRNRGVGAEFCQAIARALRIPTLEVFEKAGLLNDPFSRRFANLTIEQREIILAEMEAMLEENQRSATRKALQPTTT